MPLAQMMPGMEWIPLMLLCIAGGLIAGSLGVLVGIAVGRSRFAFRAGAVACTIGGGSTLFFLLVVGDEFSPAGYFLLASPLFVGLLAIGLSDRPPVRWLGEVEERPTESRPTEPLADEPRPSERGSGTVRAWVANRAVRVTFVLSCAAVVLVLSCVSWLRPRRDFDRLLAGDPGVEVASVLITGQGKRVLLDDPASAQYLTESFRSAVQDRWTPGTTYTAEIRLRSGGSVEIGFFVPAEGDRATMSWPLDRLGDPDYYLLRFPEPRPPSVENALRHLRQESQ